MLYLYAIAAEPGEVAEWRGVQGEVLVLLPFHDAVVIAGEVGAAPAVDAESLKAQDALVRQLHNRSAALLPMRFGMTARDAQSLARSLDAGLIERLAAVRGREQMVVRVLGATAQPAALAGGQSAARDQSGRAYLESRAQAHKGSRELEAIASAPSALQRDVRVQPATQAGVHGSVYHLIERGRAEDYRAAIERVAAALPEVRVIITGPSPAYAFA